MVGDDGYYAESFISTIIFHLGETECGILFGADMGMH
jgi:hypothetical protein